MTAAGTIGRPDSTEYAPAFAKYVNLVAAGDVQGLLEQQLAQLTELLSPVSEAESFVRHAPYTWSQLDTRSPTGQDGRPNERA